MNDPQDAYRRWEGPDHLIDEGATAFDRRLGAVIWGILIGCAIGILATAIFLTGI